MLSVVDAVLYREWVVSMDLTHERNYDESFLIYAVIEKNWIWLALRQSTDF